MEQHRLALHFLPHTKMGRLSTGRVLGCVISKLALRGHVAILEVTSLLHNLLKVVDNVFPLDIMDEVTVPRGEFLAEAIDPLGVHEAVWWSENASLWKSFI